MALVVREQLALHRRAGCAVPAGDGVLLLVARSAAFASRTALVALDRRAGEQSRHCGVARRRLQVEKDRTIERVPMAGRAHDRNSDVSGTGAALD